MPANVIELGAVNELQLLGENVNLARFGGKCRRSNGTEDFNLHTKMARRKSNLLVTFAIRKHV